MKFPAKGSLNDAKFIDILKDAASTSLTGMIRLENGSIIKVVYLQRGNVSFASSNEKSDRLTEVLKKAGKLTPEQVQDAQTRLKPNVSLGKTLVELGYISAKDLLWGARAQVDGILHQLLFWDEGKYQILEGTLPREIIHLNLSVPLVIFEGILKTHNRDWVLQHIGSPEAIYALSADFEQQNQMLKLPVSNVVAKINGKRSLHDLAQNSGMDTFELCKTVVALEYLGLAQPIQDEPLQMALNAPAQIHAPIAGEENSTTAEEEEQELGQIIPIPVVQELLTEATPTPAKESEQAEVPQQHLSPDVQESMPGATSNGDRPVVEMKEPQQEIKTPAWEPVSVAIDEPPAYDEVEEIDSPEPAHGGNKKLLLLIFLAIVAAGAIAYFLFFNPPSRTIEQPATEEKLVQQVEEAPKLPPPEMPAIIDNTPEPEQPPLASDIPPDSPLHLLRVGKLAEAAQSWNDTLKKTGYSIQLVIACQEKTVLDTHKLLNYSEEMIVLPLTYRGQSCYRVLFGQYSSERQAQAAIRSLPAVYLQQASPASVVAMSRVLS